jgi:hypothetical protein
MSVATESHQGGEETPRWVAGSAGSIRVRKVKEE